MEVRGHQKEKSRGRKMTMARSNKEVMETIHEEVIKRHINFILKIVGNYKSI